MDKNRQFLEERRERIGSYSGNEKLKNLSRAFMEESIVAKYSYNFSWMGRPVIQYPQDVVAMQEIIWDVKPDLIIETGIAHGGSLIMYASFLEMMGMEKGHVLGIDIDIREHNRFEIEKHPMFKRITMIEGSSISEGIVEKVNRFVEGYEKVMVVLDSNHTGDHVNRELELYSPFVSRGSYCVVFDTIIADVPDSLFNDRPWDKINNPKTAVHKFLETHDEFEIDRNVQDKLFLTVAPDGYLKRVK